MRQRQVGIVMRGELKVDATAEEFDFSWCLEILVGLLFLMDSKTEKCHLVLFWHTSFSF
jgi:hypothetical protein